MGFAIYKIFKEIQAKGSKTNENNWMKKKKKMKNTGKDKPKKKKKKNWNKMGVTQKKKKKATQMGFFGQPRCLWYHQ